MGKLDRKPRFLHLARQEPHPELWTQPFLDALQGLGTCRLVANGDGLNDVSKLELVQDCDILLTGWDSAPIPESVAHSPGNLQYICNLTGELKAFLPRPVIASGIPVTDWGDCLAFPVAEGAMTLLLATLKDLPQRIVHVRNGEWSLEEGRHGGSIRNLNVGIYGLGAIGVAFIDLIRPFGAVLRAYDPFCKNAPAGVEQVDSLDALFEASQAIVIHAALTDSTRGSVTKRRLAMLPDHGVLINTARGDIIDQESLFAELASGRLRAGLDVLETPDLLARDEPARQWTNCLFSTHTISAGWPSDRLELSEIQQRCLDNIGRFLSGEPLRNLVDCGRFDRST